MSYRRDGAQRRHVLIAYEVGWIELHAALACDKRQRQPRLLFAVKLHIGLRAVGMMPQNPVLNAVLEQIRSKRRL